MQAGKLDRRVRIERRTDTRDQYGQPIPTWAMIGKERWAQKSPLYGTERFISDQFVSREQVEFTVRWARDLEDLNPKDRIVYPVTTAPTDSQIYEIIAVNEIGRYEGLRIMTARRSEA